MLDTKKILGKSMSDNSTVTIFRHVFGIESIIYKPVYCTFKSVVIYFQNLIDTTIQVGKTVT